MLRLHPLLMPLALAGLLSGCIEESTPTGDEVLGTFTFQAALLPGGGCPAGDLPPDGGLAFDAVLTRLRDDAGTALVVNGVARDAGFDGQRLDSVHRALAPGFARTCNTGCIVEAEETLRILLLSRSQNEQYGKGRSCAELLDGGLPTDGGATPPGTTKDTFDAVRACGSFVTQKLPDAGCTCTQCSVQFAVEGAPRTGN